MTDATAAISRGREARRQGDLVTARAEYAAAAAIYRDQHEALFYAHTIRHIADIYVEESQQEASLKAAKPLYEEAIELYRSNLHTKLLDLANTVRPYALLLELEGNLESARPFAAACGLAGSGAF